MNLKKIAGMCKSAGSFHVTNIVNDAGEVTDQWVILGPAAYRVDNMGLTANMLARFAGIKGDQMDSYFLQDESREEADWMRDFPKQRKDMEATRATLGLIVDGREIRLYRVYGAEDILPIDTDYLAPLESKDYFVREMEGKPVAEYLLRRDATVTVCHSKTPAGALWYEMNISDIVVGAAGLEFPIKAETGHANAIIIDYGITKDQKTGELHGDVKEAPLFKYQTPVPGGMGLMVRAALLLNVLDAYKWRRGLM